MFRSKGSFPPCNTSKRILHIYQGTTAQRFFCFYIHMPKMEIIAGMIINRLVLLIGGKRFGSIIHTELLCYETATYIKKSRDK